MINIIDVSHQPRLCDGVHLKRFKGCYRLIAFIAKLDRNNKPYWVIKLSDIHSSVTAYMFSVPEKIIDLHHGAMIQCEMCVKRYKNRKYLHLIYIEKASDKLTLDKCDLDSLPSALCPKKQLLHAFCTLVNCIKSTELRDFIAQVLIPSRICLGFIQAPASLNHHHNCPGGLIAHSVEVAQIVSTMPWQDDDHRDLAITAALLHDIGKVKTLSAQHKRTNVGQWVNLCDAAMKSDASNI
ncbi:HD domain-containing protein [Psychrobium sp. nBUS_13]|uniref:HD domain-containing protein n=1 Tax=Psychrobium sp. nBUS_13 TaxID=3395319 RepID=UPI003EB86F1A